jgi:hypothetical protein
LKIDDRGAAIPSSLELTLIYAEYVVQGVYIWCRGLGRIWTEKSAVKELWTRRLDDHPPKKETGKPKAQQIGKKIQHVALADFQIYFWCCVCKWSGGLWAEEEGENIDFSCRGLFVVR